METLRDMICLIADGYHPEIYGGKPCWETIKDEGAVSRWFLSLSDLKEYIGKQKENGYEVIWIGKDVLTGTEYSACELCDVYYDGVHDENRRDRKFMVHPVYVNDEDFRLFCDHGNESQRYMQKMIRIMRETHETKPRLIICALSLPGKPYCVGEPWYSLADRSRIHDENMSADDQEDLAVYIGLCAWFESLVHTCVKAILESGAPERYSLAVLSTQKPDVV
ncbi:MAG: hypothetical protein ACI32N_08220 [Bulleidia sp.]